MRKKINSCCILLDEEKNKQWDIMIDLEWYVVYSLAHFTL
jgi:hypothetical protein